MAPSTAPRARLWLAACAVLLASATHCTEAVAAGPASGLAVEGEDGLATPQLMSGTSHGALPIRQLLAAKASKASRRRASSADQDSAVPKRLPRLSGGYLFPILAFGPNNQIAGLKEALVLGRLLNRTVVVHDIRNIYHDAKKGGVKGRMGFKLLYDFDYLAQHHSVVSLEELRAEGWDGRIEAVGHFGKAIWSWIKMTVELNVTAESATYIEFGRFDCTKSVVQRMAKKFMPYKVVGVPLAQKVVPNSMYGVELKWTGKQCHDMYLQASGHLIKSSRMRNITRRFRETKLGGADTPYIAAHIRPYTDLCLKWWHKETYDKAKAAGDCKNGHLYLVFVNETVQHMRRLEETVGRGKAKLFIMSYPELKDVITKMYEKVGLHPFFYEMSDLEAELGYKTSISMLGMVEQEISYQANIFIGSSISSMTGMVMQERFARGIPMENTPVFSSNK